jgi:UDP-N-acetylmuramate: L-alanyl-gamma-D-glutamyl-meso-diaminopimelate ligase
VFCYAGSVVWDVAEALASLGDRASVHVDLQALVDEVLACVRAGDRILVMSNGGFGGIHFRLLDRLASRTAAA